MEVLTLHRARERLTRDLRSWQLAAIGLLVLATAGNMALAARIGALEKVRAEDADRYQTQLQQAEHVRDLAVQELGALSLQAARDAEARAEQARAYEMIGAYTYIGECTVTAYCCEPYAHICGTGDGLTATGLPVAPGIVAVDESVIPLGSTVIIDGQRYLAADTGSAVNGLHVDICVDTHAIAKEFGVRNADVWIIPPETGK